MIEIKTIILCADDFGLNPGVSEGILQLTQAERLSAVSCMVNMTYFNHYAKDLMALKDKVQCGLHFNLTEGFFLSQPDKPCFNLNELLIKTHLNLISSSFIATECNAQLDRYISTMGGLPDFIDGHQHVHQFPKIRSVLLNIYEQRLRKNKTWIRSTYPTLVLPPFQWKATVLDITGGRALHQKLKQQKIPHNPYFSGIYNFAKDSDYRTLFRQWLRMAHENTLFMCHPGLNDSNIDSIAYTRPIEMNYLSGTEFLDDCEEYQIKQVKKEGLNARIFCL